MSMKILGNHLSIRGMKINIWRISVYLPLIKERNCVAHRWNCYENSESIVRWNERVSTIVGMHGKQLKGEMLSAREWRPPYCPLVSGQAGQIHCGVSWCPVCLVSNQLTTVTIDRRSDTLWYALGIERVTNATTKALQQSICRTTWELPLYRPQNSVQYNLKLWPYWPLVRHIVGCTQNWKCNQCN